MWSGAIVDIPDGWLLCDGNNGTPNLLNRCIIGAGEEYNPGDTDGSATHKHDNNMAHRHSVSTVNIVSAGAGAAVWNAGADGGNVDYYDQDTDTASGSSMQLSYALAFIKRVA